MKYLKYYLFFIIVLIGFLVSRNEDVNAYSLGLDFGNNSPRFQYLLDDDNVIIPFEFEVLDLFDTPYLAEDSDYIMTLNQVNYDGYFIKQLRSFDLDFIPINSTIEYFTLEQTSISPSYTDNEVFVLYGLDFLMVSGVTVNAVPLTEDDYDVVFDTDLQEYFLIIIGNKSITGDAIIITYTKETSDEYIADLYYNWGGLQWGDNNITFYQLEFDGLVIWSGAVMQPPQDDYLIYNAYGLEVGEFLVEDGLLQADIAGFTDQSQFTSLDDDRYIILHYRLPSTLVYPNYMSIRVTDTINNTLIDAFTTEDLLQVQGGETSNFYNSFIVIPIDNVISEGLKIDYPVSFNDGYELLLDDGYVEGSYYFAIDDNGTLLDGASVVWNIIDDDNYPFELYLTHYELALNSLQRTIFYKNSTIIYDGYTTTFAKDFDVGSSYVDAINETNLTYSIEYYPDSTLVEGDSSYFSWRVQPLFMPYSLDVTDFTISMKEIYIYGGERGVATDIANLRTAFGMKDEVGGIAFAILVLVGVNILLLFVTRASFIFAMTNITLIAVLSFFSLIPIWFVVAILLLSFLGIKFKGGGVESYE